MITKKGKKKYLNLFDLLIASGLIGLIVIFGLFLLKRSKTVEVIVKITNEDILNSWGSPPNWFSYYFREGMMAKDSLGRKTAEIKKVYRYDTGPNTKAVYLTLNLKADYSGGTGQLSYEGKSLLIGMPIKIEFQDILTEGLVTYIEGIKDDRPSKEMLVEVYKNDMPVYITEAINIDDQVKDSLNNVLITVVDKKIEPARKVIEDQWANLFIRQDPLTKDMTLILKLRVIENSNKINGHEYYLFDNVRVNINEPVPLHLKNISFYPVITKILEVK